MNINTEKLEKLLKKQGINLKTLLEKSAVSKTAYFNLIYKDRLLPKSIYAISETLEVNPSAFLEEINSTEKKFLMILKLTDDIILENPKLSRENVRHTLILLDEKPIERLRRGLKRGRRFNIYQKRD